LTKEQLFKDGKTCQVCKRCSRDLQILQEELARNEERFETKVAIGVKKESEREQNITDAKLTAAAKGFINSAKVEGHGLTLTFKPPHREPPVLGGAAGALGGAAGFVAGVANNPLAQMGADFVPGGGALLAGIPGGGALLAGMAAGMAAGMGA
jgi:hypothetical protein